MTNFLKSFASDNYAGVHPQILNALTKCAEHHAPAYGNDDWTSKATTLFKRHFGDDLEVLFVFNGTGANIVGLDAVTAPYQSIVCAHTAHINVDECGAIEKITGSRLIPVSTVDGKLTPELVLPHLRRFGDEHHSQPRVISISQVTECGTLYQPHEIEALSKIAHQHDMILHMDGSRLCNAAAALSTTLMALTRDVGVDVLSFGGTKNGMMYGEAVVFFDKVLGKNAKYYRKQNGQLSSKHRFIAAQFIEMLSSDLWIKNAMHANQMAGRLAAGIKALKPVVINKAVESNVIFASMPLAMIEELQKKYLFYLWDERINEVRWMTSFDTTEREVDEFVRAIHEVAQ